MSMLKFVKKSDRAKDMADKLVAEAESSPKTKGKGSRGSYKSYTPEKRFQIGKVAAEQGNKYAVAKFSDTDRKINESTVRTFKKLYYERVSEQKKRKYESDSSSDVDVTELIPKKRGRKVLLGDELDSMVQDYILGIRNSGGIVNTAIVMAAGRGIVLSKDRALLAENGGSIDITRNWALSLMKRMNFVKRKGTTSKKIIRVENFEELKVKFLNDIQEKVQTYQIPDQLVVNWDQTGLNVVPVAKWTMGQEGAKRIEIAGVDDKRQITGTFAGTMAGDFLPMQLIYGGKTSQCHPRFKFPAEFHITHSENHWANSATMDEYIHKIIVPYVDKIKFDLDLPLAQKALVVFDCFRGQITEEFRDLLKRNHLLYVCVPPNCTDLLQPMDLSVNKCAKDFLKSKFQQYYADEVMKQVKPDGSELAAVKVDLSLTVLKPLGAKWLTQLYDYLKSRPEIIKNGFAKAGILSDK